MLRHHDCLSGLEGVSTACVIRAYFAYFASFWAILGHLATLGHFGHFWVILGHLGPFCAILAILVILGHLGPFGSKFDLPL